jgi:hypothetical protein
MIANNTGFTLFKQCEASSDYCRNIITVIATASDELPLGLNGTKYIALRGNKNNFN